MLFANLEKALTQQRETQTQSDELQKSLDEMKAKLIATETNLKEIAQECEQLKVAKDHEADTQQQLTSQILFAESRQQELQDATTQAYPVDDEDEIDVDKLTFVLDKIRSASVATSSSATVDEQAAVSTPMQPATNTVKRIIDKKDKFPLLGKPHANGLTLAQHYVIEGNFEALDYLLKLDPMAVNSLPEGHSNKLNKNTLLELALFEMRFRVTAEMQKKIIELILSYRPIIFHSDLDVSLNVCNRLRAKSNFSPDLRKLFCHYVIAQRTCSVVNRTEFFDMMNAIEEAVGYLKSQENMVVLDNLHLDQLLGELDESIKVCRMIYAAYKDQNYSLLDEFLKAADIKPVQDADKVFVLDDDDTRVKAYLEHESKTKQKPMIEYLLAIIQERLKSCLFVTRRQYIGMDREMGVVQETNNNAPPFKWQEIEAPKVDDVLGYYRALVLNLQKIISTHGVVLMSGGFNDCQKEFIKVHCQHASVAPSNVAPSSSFFGSQPGTPREHAPTVEKALKFG